MHTVFYTPRHVQSATAMKKDHACHASTSQRTYFIKRRTKGGEVQYRRKNETHPATGAQN